MPRSFNLGCPHDKTLGGVSDISKWIARDQSQRVAVARLQDLGLIGINDGGRLHLIFEFTLRALDVYFIALPYVSQCPEERVAMTRQHQVTALARTRRTPQVSDAARQRVIGGSLEHHRG